MIDNTINDAKTVAGGGKDIVLAGRYHIGGWGKSAWARFASGRWAVGQQTSHVA